jgi:hypothetical protein
MRIKSIKYRGGMEEIKLYKGKIKIYFAERDWGGRKIHEYTDDEGNKLVSVTTITSLLDKSNFLLPWAVRMMGDYLLQTSPGQQITEGIINIAKVKWRDAKQEAADIGSEIHNWIEQKIKGLEPAIPENEQVRNGAAAFLKWIKDSNIKFKETERVVYSKKYNYVGTCDWYGTHGKELIIGDHKSSRGIYNEMRYQLAGYWLALEEELGKKISRGIIVKFDKETAEFEARGIDREDYLKDKEAFLGLLQLKRREVELANYGRKTKNNATK